MQETMNRDIEQSSIRELSLDEAEAVGGGFSWSGLAHSVGYAAGAAVRGFGNAEHTAVRDVGHVAGAAVSGFKEGYRG